MAEFVMKELVRRKGIDENFYIESAATSTEEIGNDTYPKTKEILTEHGIPFTKRKARQITLDDYDAFDYLIGMDEANRRNIKRAMKNDPANKVYLLLDFTNKPKEISDPWYSGDFETTYKEVLKGCEALLKELGY